MGHENERADKVSLSCEGDVCCCDGAKVVADDGVNVVIAEGVDKLDRVIDERQGPEGVAGNRFEVWRVCATVTSLVECDGVVARFREAREDVAPGVGQFREAVDTEDERWTGGAGGLGNRFEDVEVEGGCIYEPTCYAGWQFKRGKGFRVDGEPGCVLGGNYVHVGSHFRMVLLLLPCGYPDTVEGHSWARDAVSWIDVKAQLANSLDLSDKLEACRNLPRQAAEDMRDVFMSGGLMS